MARILIADDEEKLGRLLTDALAAEGHDVVHVRGGREALSQLSGSTFDLVLTDLRMPEVGGLQVLEAARARPSPPSVLMMTAFGSTDSAVAAMKAGAVDYLTKPFSIDELRLRVRRAAEARLSATRGARLVQSLTPSLIANSEPMSKVLEMARRVAPTAATVLLLGETGTGKTQLARYIHFTSPRAGGELVEVHCSAMPETLLESELFGHARGAFTGATVSREGHLARADGGSLFLDEIGEISASTQVKLLRVLQDRTFTPVGTTQERTVDARVIAATNRDLGRAVKDGRFREDLYFRLNVFAIVVPPLRERREDIEPLVDAFLRARGLPPGKVSAEARRQLAARRWPGNIRELENALERALILAGDAEVEPGFFPEESAAAQPTTVLAPGFSLDDFERGLITEALARAGGNKTQAAKLLGITRRRLYSRLESLGSKEQADDPPDPS